MPVDCAIVAANACVWGVCDAGVCTELRPIDCDDRDPCTADSCDLATGCVHTRTCGACTSDADCDDAQPCTADACLGGQCVSGPRAEICGNGLDDDCDGATDTGCAWRVADGAPAAGADGRSWGSAFPTIAQALAVASAGDSVWVAAGTYRPATAKAAVVTMKAGVALYGGFAGDEDALAHRPDPLALTTLDGDFDFSAGPSANDSTHVVVGASGARLDGFVVRGGWAAGSSGATAQGGGLYQAAVTGLVVARCRFTANQAQQGGAFTDMGTAAAGASGATFVDTRFDANAAIWGGAVRLYATGTWTFTNCLFDNNSGSSGGGALWSSQTGGALTVAGGLFTRNSGAGGGALGTQNSGAAIHLTGTTFIANTSGDNGGAVSFKASTGVTVTGCLFRDNRAGTGTSIIVGAGAGLYATGSNLVVTGTDFFGNEAVKSDGGGASVTDGTASFSDCRFAGNTTVKAGGGLYANGPNPLTVTRVDFSCNSAAASGGGLYAASATGTLSDSTFVDNEASSVGGGMYAVAGALAVSDTLFARNRVTSQSGGGAQLANTPGSSVRDCTFRDNTSADTGGGLSLVTNTDIPIANCTFSGNTAKSGGGLYTYGSDPTVTGCSFRGNSGSTEGGGVLARYAAPVILNGAFFGNASVAYPIDIRSGTGGAAAASFSCFSSGPTGTGNVTLATDPFTVGPAGELFLKHAGLDGATATTPCADAGSDAAATAAGISWSTLTTRSDGALDASPVDMGRHHTP